MIRIFRAKGSHGWSCIKQGEDGVAIIELSIALVIIAIVSLGMTWSVVMSLGTMKRTEVHNAASSLALSRLEAIAAVDVGNIDASFNGTEAALSWTGLDNVSFTRVTTVTANADQSRTVEVQVTSNSSPIPADVTFTSRFALWE